MNRWLLVAALCFFALPAQAQYVQGGAVNAAPDTIGGDWTAKSSYSFTFAQPLVAPCTLLVTVRQPGMLVTDSQGNVFSLLTSNPGQSGQAFSSPTCASGADTITVSCPSGTCWAQATFSAYAGVWTLAQMAPDAESIGSVAATLPVTPTVNGSLIVSFGSNHTTNRPQITSGAGFTLRASGNEFIEDFIQPTAAPVVGSATYSASVSWCQMTLVFTPATLPQRLSLIVKASLLWCTLCNQTDDVAASGSLVIAQTNGPTGTFVIRTDGSISASGIIDIAQDPLEFTFWLIDSSGTAQPGASMKLTFPRFELAGPSFTLGTFSLGVVRIAHTTDSKGNPAVRIASIDQFKLL